MDAKLDALQQMGNLLETLERKDQQIRVLTAAVLRLRPIVEGLTDGSIRIMATMEARHPEAWYMEQLDIVQNIIEQVDKLRG